MIFTLFLLLALATILFFIAQKFQNPTKLIIRIIAFLLIALVIVLYLDMANMIPIGII